MLYATIALIDGASLTLTSIGRYLPGTAQIKKIKRDDRLPVSGASCTSRQPDLRPLLSWIVPSENSKMQRYSKPFLIFLSTR